MGKRQTDWEAVEREYSLGQKSVRTIASEYDIAHTTITRKAKKEGWVQDKSQEIRRKTEAALLVTHQEERTNKRTTPTKEDIDKAVSTNIEVVHRHWRIIKRTLDLAESLLTEAEKPRTAIKVRESVFKTVSAGLSRVIPLERQAFNLDDGPEDNYITLKVVYEDGNAIGQDD